MSEDKEFKDSEANIRSHIEAGRIGEAQSELHKLTQKNNSRVQKLAVANLLRRAKLPEKAITILRPYVRPSSKKQFQATDQEKLEYAAALTFLGSTNESQNLLNTIHSKELDEYLLFQAFNHIKVWNYEESIPFLEKLLTQSQDAYLHAVTSINLLQAYIYCSRLDNAEKIFQDKPLKNYLSTNQKHRLLCNFHELKAQFFFQQKQWDHAETELKQAQSFSDGNNSIDQLFVKKWNFLVELYKNPSTDKRTMKMQWEQIRLLAQSLGNAETLRDIDFHFSLKIHSIDTIKYVYWGTPFISYREKIKKNIQAANILFEHLGTGHSRTVYTTNEVENPQALAHNVNCVDLNDVCDNIEYGGESLLSRLLFALNADYYRGASSFFIFESVYQDEYYNPDSSPLKIRQLIFRLKEKFQEHNYPLTVNHRDGVYWLSSTSKEGCNISFDERRTGSKEDQLARKIYDIYQSDYFKAKDLSERLAIPQRTLSCTLKELLKKDLIEKIGSGPKTTYRIKNKKQ